MSKVWEYFKEMKIVLKCRACNSIECHCDDLQELEWQASQVQDQDQNWR
tara:strand:+ start:2411 stop:2557 length:147 start_codon:yes stop_codon:yes gene_type:complete